MPHTREQRDRHALCGAKRKNGERCRLFAGQGTSHRGTGRCFLHLGNTRGHQTHAVKVEAQRRAIQFGEKIDIAPSEALLTVLHLSYGHLEFIRAELGALLDQPSFERDVLLRAWDDERDRVARIGKAALDAGVQERQIQLAERYGELLARLLQGIFNDVELALTKKQQAKLPTVLRRHLVAVDEHARAELTA
jgi:hypothetical protein